METIRNQEEAMITRKLINNYRHELTLLEEEKGVLPTEIYFQRKKNLFGLITFMEDSLRNFKLTRTVLVY